MAFAAHAAGLGAREMSQVGGRHVVSFFRSNRHLAPSTQYSYWLAIRELWHLSQKKGEPPKPKSPVDQAVPSASEATHATAV